MSISLYPPQSLRFWTGSELERRERLVQEASSLVRETLRGLNPAWQFERCEGPILTPASSINKEYNAEDVFETNHIAGGETLKLRAETTHSTYVVAKHLMQSFKWAKPPLCVWQLGKSFRRETNDGASPSKLRYNEFNQLEFQCIYRADTKADYRSALVEALLPFVSKFTGLPARVIESDRLPNYSESTIDIEVESSKGFKELASCSIRNDFSEDLLVCEIAIGVDRVLDVQ